MAANCFMKVDGFEGESTDKKFSKWFELHSFSHGLSQPSSGEHSTGGAISAERCEHQNLVVHKDLDKASPKFMEFCMIGKHIKKIELHMVRQVNSQQVTYMKYELSDSIVADYEQSGSGGVPTDTIAFNYGGIKWTYTEMDHKTGQNKGDVPAGWDLTENKATV